MKLSKWQPLLLSQVMIWIVSFFCSNYLSNYIRYLPYLFGRQERIPHLQWLVDSKANHWGYYTFVYVLLTVLSISYSFKFHRQFGDLREGNKGNDRFSTLKEIEKAYKAIPYHPQYVIDEETGELVLKRYPGYSGCLISSYTPTICRLCDKIPAIAVIMSLGEQPIIQQKLPWLASHLTLPTPVAFIDQSDCHSIVVARTRGGKDETKLLPDLEIISRSEEMPHIINTTTKYETIEKTKLELEARGYQVSLMNLIDLDKSFGYNPLKIIVAAYIAGNIDEAVELCKTFTHPLYYNPNSKDPIWEDSAMALVNACILALCYEFVDRPKYITLSSLVSMLIELSGTYQLKQETRYMLDEYFSSLSLDNPARQEYSTIGVTSGQMRSSIFGSALAKLQKFVAPSVAKLMNRTTFEFERLVSSKPQAVFILLPDYTETNYIIASTFIQQAYYYLSKYASEHGDRLKKRVRFLLNEFGNMPAFVNISSMISVGAGRGMLFDFYVQDLVQFKITYGEDRAKFIQSQLMNLVYLTTTDHTTLEIISKMLGNREVIQKTRSGKFLSKTSSETVEKRPLMYPPELGRLLEGEWVVIRSKRVNDQYEDVLPYPIFNHGTSRMQFAYRYLSSVFRRFPIDKLNLSYHCNREWKTSELAEFTNTMRRRLLNSNHLEIQQLEQANLLNNQKKEVQEKMSKLNLSQFQKYGGSAFPLTAMTAEMLSDTFQFDAETIEEHETYQELARRVHQYHPTLKSAFNKISTYDDMLEFLESHKHIFQKLYEQEVAANA